MKRREIPEHEDNDDRLITRQEVERLTSLSRSTIYRRIAEGLFPRPKKLSVNRVGWRLGDILHWLRNR